MGHEFDEDTRVEAVAANHFAATVTDRWGAVGARPNGGYLLGICMRALAHAMPFPDPLAVSAHFLRPAVPGAASVRTELTRSGRHVATGDARLLQNDRELVRVVATFTDLSRASGRTLLLSEMPKLPAVTELGEPASSTLELTVHVRARPAPGWLACRVSTRYVTNGYHEEDFEIWDSGGTLVAQSRQLAMLAANERPPSGDQPP